MIVTVNNGLKVGTLLRHSAVIVLLITCMGAMLRFHGLGSKYLWLDEARIFWISQAGFDSIVSENTANSSAPPLYPFLVALVSQFGKSEAILRLTSCIFGIMAIHLMYFLARQFSTQKTAYFSATLFALSPFQVEYSQQLREYSLTAMITILLLMAYCKFIERPNFVRTIILATIIFVGVFTQYGLVLLTVSIGLVAFFFLLKSDRPYYCLSYWFSAHFAIIVAIFILLFLGLREQIGGGAGGLKGTVPGTHYITKYFWDGSMSSFLNISLRSTGKLFHNACPAEYLSFGLCSVAAITLIKKRTNLHALLFLTIPILTIWITSIFGVYPYNGHRQNIFLMPMIYVFIGLGISVVASTSNSRLVTSMLVAVLMSQAFPRQLRNYYRMYERGAGIQTIVQRLHDDFKPGEKIYVYYLAEPTFRYYWGDQQENLVRGVWLWSEKDREKDFAQIEDMMKRHTSVWLVYHHVIEGDEDIAIKYLSEKYDVTKVLQKGNSTLYRVLRIPLFRTE